MQLDARHEAELARRHGRARRTVLMLIWLAISAGLAYAIARWLVTTAVIRPEAAYRQLSLPAWVPEWAIFAGLVLLIVIAMQLLLILGYVLFSPEGHRRLGRPSLDSRHPDPLDDDRSY